MAQQNNKLGIALLGLGKYAAGQLAPALQETTHCYLAGIISGSPSKINEWKKQYHLKDENCYNYENLEAIKNNPDIDIIYIVTPNATHADFVIRAAQAGKHVICEKPMATSVEDCDKMIAACKKAGVSLSVGYRLHFEPYNRHIMQLGQTHKFGYIQELVAKDGIAGTEGWRLDKKLAGEGGPLMDLGIYCLQAANYVYALSPIAVSAEQSGATVSFRLEYPGGYSAQCECSYEKAMNYLHAKANNGWFELEPAFGYSGIQGKTALGKMAFDQVNQQAIEMDTIAKAIQQHKPSPVPGEIGRTDVQVLTAIVEAIQSGGRILLHPEHTDSATNETGGAINGTKFVVAK